MRRPLPLLLVLGSLLLCAAFRTPLGVVAAVPAGPVAELSVGDALVLGLVEGITEFLPISSTGHLIIADHALRLDADAPLTDTAGRPLWYQRPSAHHPAGEPLTLKLAADTYSVVIQFGAIAAVALLYWPQLLGIGLGLLGRNPAGLRLLRNLLVAFLPAALLGLLLDRWIGRHLFSVRAVVVAQISGAVLMLAAEHWRRKYATSANAVLNPAYLPASRALGIGLMQCLALWPGMSRSMTTIVGGYFAGFEPRLAAEFSFLLGFITLAAATVYKSYDSGLAMIAVFGWPHVLLGAVVATLSAAAAVRFLVHYLTRHGLAVFAWYRLVLAAALGVLFLM
ncbi:MAG TPA: undecaprenyl-diphosphate phosphatase [Opitutaceae bacterium]|nr:undecaprenyl-diphosphate phosphatase [Opitutaceae bacterium]